jgi:hypothetical protein
VANRFPAIGAATAPPGAHLKEDSPEVRTLTLRTPARRRPVAKPSRRSLVTEGRFALPPKNPLTSGRAFAGPCANAAAERASRAVPRIAPPEITRCILILVSTS